MAFVLKVKTIVGTRFSSRLIYGKKYLLYTYVVGTFQAKGSTVSEVQIAGI